MYIRAISVTLILMSAVSVPAIAQRQSSSVDGKVLSRQKMEHTIPFLMALDESLDIGMDTRTPVDDSYKLPFEFTGKILMLTYKIGREQFAANDRERIKRALATAHD